MAQSSKKTITTMVECGLLTAFLCVVAPWSIPIGLIPITLSTFAIYVISAVLNWKKAIVSVFLYLLLGAVGVPVFSGFSGGLGKLVGVTGGFLLGYLLCTLICGGLIDHFEKVKWMYPVAMVLGTIALYALGVAWFVITTDNSIYDALIICVLPFLIGDAIKIAVASVLGYSLRFQIKKRVIK